MLEHMGHSRADVVAAALRVLDTQGLEFCTMRRVAAELDVQPSALYHHVPNKQALLALMADEIVRGVAGASHDGNGAAAAAVPDVAQASRTDIVQGTEVQPVPGSGTAASGTGDPAGLCRALRQAMLAVRDGADVVATASAYRLGASEVEAALAEALRARFPDLSGVDAVESARTLLLFVFGHSQATQMQLQALEFQALAGGRPADAAGDPPGASRAGLEASFDRGVATILAGIAALASSDSAAARA